MGSPSKYIHDLVIDFDLSSLYPSIIQCFNISASTQYGRLKIDTNKPHNYGNVEGRDIGGEVLDDLNSKDFNNFCEKHFGLPTTDDLIMKFNKKLKEREENNE